MALNKIQSEDTFMVEQSTNWMEGCMKCFFCCADFENVYHIKAGKEKKPFITIKEDSGCTSRMLCNPNHKLDLNWKPSSGGDTVVRMHKPFKWCCPAIIPCFQKEAEIYKGGKQIGLIQQPWCAGGLKPKLSVFEPNADGGEMKNMGHISGPFCCIGACCSSEWNFFDRNGKEHVTMKRGGMSDIGVAKSLGTNSDTYWVKFEDKTTSLDERIVMLAGVIMVDYLFFEGETNCTFNWCQCAPPFLICPPELWCKLCDIYCCGSTIPVKCKCCISEATELAMKSQTGGL